MLKYLSISFFLITTSVFSQQGFISEEYGFQISFPDGWSVEKGTVSMVAVIARLNNNTSINVVVQDRDISKENNIALIDVEKFKEDLEEKYKEHFKNYKTVDFGRATVNIYNSIYFIYNCEFNGNTLRVKQYFLFKENKIYVISTGCLESEFYNFFEVPFKETVNSFIFTK